MASPRKVAFTEDAARRIAAATRAYERGNRDMPPIRFRTAGGDDAADNIRFGRITDGWAFGAHATITRLNADGSERSPAETFSALNQIADIKAAERFVFCVLVDTTWMLASAELDRVEVVSNVRWENGLMVEKRFVWCLVDPAEPTEAKVLDALECPPC